MLWGNRTWAELRKDLAVSAQAAILPVGATEQHGPHLGCGMDTLLADRLCSKVAAHTHVPMLPVGRWAGGAAKSRNADGAVNPYLAAALALAAGLEGIRERIDPGDPNEDNLYTISDQERRNRNIEFLPQTPQEAVSAFAVRPADRSDARQGVA